MLWLIWIALMLLAPIMAGVRVWWQLRHEPAQAAVTTSAGGAEPLRASDSH
jgi:hypothetical protein